MAVPFPGVLSGADFSASSVVRMIRAFSHSPLLSVCYNSTRSVHFPRDAPGMLHSHKANFNGRIPVAVQAWLNCNVCILFTGLSYGRKRLGSEPFHHARGYQAGFPIEEMDNSVFNVYFTYVIFVY